MAMEAVKEVEKKVEEIVIEGVETVHRVQLSSPKQIDFSADLILDNTIRLMEESYRDREGLEEGGLELETFDDFSPFEVKRSRH